MIQLRKTLETAHRALEQAGVDHALIGGFALAAHGVNRATVDIDLLVDGVDRDAAKRALVTAGFVLKSETSEVLQFGGLGYLDLLLANRPLSKTMLQEAKILPPTGIKCLAAEDIIGLKIQAYKNDPKRELKDQADIQSLIQKNPGLDWAKIKKYADLFNEWKTVEAIRKKS